MKRALACFKTHPQFAKAFTALGNEWTPTEELKREIERFTCTLYGNKTATGVDKLRYQLFQKKYNVSNNLPPNRDSLDLHIMRAAYQAGINRRCLVQNIAPPSPLAHGWMQDEN